MSDAISYQLDGDIAVVTLDDGKANALCHDLVDGLSAALDRAETEARALVLVGREGKFSAGFDLATMTASEDSMRSLVIDGARMLFRLYGLGIPTVAACTGHALAAGSLMLLASDHRVGAAGAAKIGLNEVAIGMALPVFAVELARQRLTTTAFGDATMGARIYDPDGAVASGYLDQVVEPAALLETAMAEARRLAILRTGAYARTKQVARGPMIEQVLAGLVEDMQGISTPSAAGKA